MIFHVKRFFIFLHTFLVCYNRLEVIIMGYANRTAKYNFYCTELNRDVTVTINYHQDEKNYYRQYECGRECSHRDVCPHACPKKYYEFDI